MCSPNKTRSDAASSDSVPNFYLFCFPFFVRDFSSSWDYRRHAKGLRITFHFFQLFLFLFFTFISRVFCYLSSHFLFRPPQEQINKETRVRCWLFIFVRHGWMEMTPSLVYSFLDKPRNFIADPWSFLTNKENDAQLIWQATTPSIVKMAIRWAKLLGHRRRTLRRQSPAWNPSDVGRSCSTDPIRSIWDCASCCFMQHMNRFVVVAACVKATR